MSLSSRWRRYSIVGHPPFGVCRRCLPGTDRCANCRISLPFARTIVRLLCAAGLLSGRAAEEFAPKGVVCRAGTTASSSVHFVRTPGSCDSPSRRRCAGICTQAKNCPDGSSSPLATTRIKPLGWPAADVEAWQQVASRPDTSQARERDLLPRRRACGMTSGL